MSIRAHKVTKFVFAQEESFNLWHDDEIRKGIETHGLLQQLDEGGGGLLSIEPEEMEKILDESNLIDEERKRKLREEIEVAKAHDDTLMYYCF